MSISSYYEAGPTEYEAAPAACTAPACPKCHGCEAACAACPACSCDRCEECGDRVADHSRAALIECGLWCHECDGVCTCRESPGATCGHCAPVRR